MRSLWGLAIAAGLVLLVTSCAVGPHYQRASVQIPSAWRAQAPWRAAAPKDGIPKGKWWTLFNDADLNGYEDQATAANQTIASALARLEQARALAYVASSTLFPQLEANVSAQRQRLSANRPSSGTTLPTTASTQNAFTASITGSYEADIFGSNRGNLESANATLQATAADLENARLVVTAELATDYFSLREIDAEIEVVQQALQYQQQGLDLVQNRNRGGIASGLDVAQQQTVLESTRAQFDLLQRERSQFEHAIAVLLGQPSSTFQVPVRAFNTAIPAVPTGVPSDILERRPDVASAERQMAATNARVGIAQAAFYPSITLGTQGGLQSRDLSTLINAPSAIWALGAGLVQPLFNGGRNHAELAFAEATYNTSVADYRQNVLIAFQQVEDALSGLDALASAAESQQQAVDAARRALTLANNRYVGGLVSYLDVINAQQTLLTNERLSKQILGQQLMTSVLLVKSLGGGWDATALNPMQVRPTAGQALKQ